MHFTMLPRFIVVLLLSILPAACDALAPPQPAPVRLTPVALPTPTPQPTATAVARTTQPVVKGVVVQSIQAGGSLIPSRQVPVNAPIAGLLAELKVKQGDVVKEGDVIGKIGVADADSKRLDAQQRLVKARLDLEQAKANPPDLASKVEDTQMNIEQLKLELSKLQHKDYDRDLAKAQRSLERSATRAKDLRYFWEQIKWKNNSEAWDLGAKAEDAEDAAVAAKEQLQNLIDSKEIREREQQLLKRKIDLAERQVATLQRTATLQQQSYELQLELLNAAAADTQKLLDSINFGVPIRSPLTGMVTAVNANTGDAVDPTRPILTIAEATVTKAAVSLSETDIVHVTIGQAVSVLVPALGETSYEARVSWIATTAQQQGKDTTFQVILEVNGLDQRAKVGMTANARVETERRENVLLVPNNAVRSRQGRRFVEVVAGGEVREVPVEIGLRTDTETEVLSGLTEGQLVVVGSRVSGETNRP